MRIALATLCYLALTLLGFSLPLSASAVAQTATLVVNNNTGATLTVFTQNAASQRDSEEAEIPPESVGTLTVRQGRNIVWFVASRMTSELTYTREIGFYHSGRHEMDVFPSDFGVSAMFDAPGSASGGESGGVSARTDCRGLDCYDQRSGRFINGSGIGTGEYNQTAASCAARCNADSRCLSFEMYENDFCSINMRSTKTDPDILSESDNYTYYEHRFRPIE